MSNHTKEPWVIGFQKAGDNKTLVSWNMGDYVAFEVAEFVAQVDAERAVACVNFCAGLSNEQLQDNQEKE